MIKLVILSFVSNIFKFLETSNTSKLPWKCLKRALPLQACFFLQWYELCKKLMKIGSKHCSIFRYSPPDDG
ncbi:unnamed protein product [Larinioides sclopetarius]|uniref:Uncharacterized protein n=1 Tax=Larinioides sclopetarius TaxID=280406 RepID=A0AAV2AAE1_9ARAC